MCACVRAPQGAIERNQLLYGLLISPPATHTQCVCVTLHTHRWGRMGGWVGEGWVSLRNRMGGLSSWYDQGHFIHTPLYVHACVCVYSVWRPHPNLGSTIDPQTPTQNPPLLVFVSSCLFQLVLRSPSNPQTPQCTPPPSSSSVLSVLSVQVQDATKNIKHTCYSRQRTAHLMNRRRILNSAMVHCRSNYF